MKKRLLILFFIFIPFSIFTVKTFAREYNSNSDFSFSYDVKYDIDSALNIHISKKALITNLTADKYLPFIDINFDTPNIASIHAFDDIGPIEPLIDRTQTSSSIRIVFHKPVLGIGKKISYTLNYDNPHLITKEDNKITVSLPKADNDPQVIAYNVTLNYPSNIGSLEFIVPAPRTKSYFWELDQIRSRGITLVFDTNPAQKSQDFVKTNDNTELIKSQTPYIIQTAVAALFIIIGFIFALKIIIRWKKEK